MTGKLPFYILGGYLAIVSLTAFITTVYDKWAAKHRPKHRVREKHLIELSFLGGSVVMLITMLIIRHKTKHLKFMLGIPLIILIQTVIICMILYFFKIDFIFFA